MQYSGFLLIISFLYSKPLHPPSSVQFKRVCKSTIVWIGLKFRERPRSNVVLPIDRLGSSRTSSQRNAPWESYCLCLAGKPVSAKPLSVGLQMHDQWFGPQSTCDPGVDQQISYPKTSSSTPSYVIIFTKEIQKLTKEMYCWNNGVIHLISIQ